MNEAKPYQKDMDFAFFAANFGYSKAEYEQLTPREVRFLYKAYEDRIVSESYRIYNAVYTAFYNANRPKRKRALKLFKKKNEKVSKEIAQENLAVVLESQRNDGDWVRKLYAANNYIVPPGGEKSGKPNSERKSNRRCE